MHEGAVYNVACVAMPGQTMNVLADECQEGVALFCVSMQEYVLDDKSFRICAGIAAMH